MRALASSADGEAALRPVSERPHRLSPRPVVLLVEDDVLVRLAIFDFLEADGFTVLEASSGDDAIKVLVADGWRVDVVFSDIRMPGEVDGLALAKWMTENFPSDAGCTAGLIRELRRVTGTPGSMVSIRKRSAPAGECLHSFFGR